MNFFLKFHCLTKVNPVSNWSNRINHSSKITVIQNVNHQLPTTTAITYLIGRIEFIELLQFH